MTTATKTKVAICGPNLRDQSKGSFHVHTADCKDLLRMAKRDAEFRPDYRMDMEAGSIQEIVEFVYGDQMAESEEGSGWDTWEPYESDFHFAPCVHLPRESD